MANSSIISNDQTSGLMDCIANDIPSRAFRYATESKNVLSTAGAMYIGTGLKRKTTMLLDAPNWVFGSNYNAGDIVTYFGHNYKAINNIAESIVGPAGDISHWNDISITYTSYVTAVLQIPNSSAIEGAHLEVRPTELLYQDNGAVCKDADGYIVGRTTAGATHVTGYFPCWCNNNSQIIAAPVVIGGSLI